MVLSDNESDGIGFDDALKDDSGRLGSGNSSSNDQIDIDRRRLSIFGAWLKRKRIGSGLTLKGLAEKSGIDVKTLNLWELGDIGRPQQANLEKLAGALGVDLPTINEVVADSVMFYEDVVGSHAPRVPQSMAKN